MNAMQNIDYWFVEAVKQVWYTGEQRPGRNGGTRSLFGYRLDYNMKNGFPIIGVKKTFFNASVGEMIAFMSGADKAEEFRKQGCNFWDANAKSEYWLKNPNHPTSGVWDTVGFLGSIYGVQWRYWRGFDGEGNFKGVDQLENLLRGLRSDPYGRRHIVSAWQPAELDQMALPPCHVMFQVYCHVDGKISLHLYQRSADLFLGVPYNITGYAFLLHLLAWMTGRVPHRLVIDFGDFHLYEVHETEDEALTKLFAAVPEFDPRASEEPPVLVDNQQVNWEAEDFSSASMARWGSPDTRPFTLNNYVHGPTIRARMIE